MNFSSLGGRYYGDHNGAGLVVISRILAMLDKFYIGIEPFDRVQVKIQIEKHSFKSMRMSLHNICLIL